MLKMKASVGSSPAQGASDPVVQLYFEGSLYMSREVAQKRADEVNELLKVLGLYLEKDY